MFTIGIDASRAFLPKRTGIEEYSYQIIKALRSELAEEQVILYVRGTDNLQRTTNNQTVDCQLEIPSGWKVKELWSPRFWTQGRLSLEMLFHKPDVLFVPAHTVSWIHPKNTVVTIHGLEYEFCPEAYSLWDRWYMRFSIKNSCRWASKIIAVSENTKRDLVRLYGVPEEKIKVVYEGNSNEQLTTDNLQRTTEDERLILDDEGLGIKNKELGDDSKFKISKPYFLFIGRIEMRKNVGRMIEAFDLFKKKYGTNHTLVLAGKPGYGYEKIRNQKLGIQHAGDIVELGYVSEEEKWGLLRGADGFLFPSLYEGFGLPILEAQSVGIPVLTSNTSSLPEVSGESGAVFVNPESVEDITFGMEKLALERDFRNAIIESGFKNVARFSWEKCAKEIAEALKGK